MKLFQRVSLALLAATIALPVMAADAKVKTHHVAKPVAAKSDAAPVAKKGKHHHHGMKHHHMMTHSLRQNADNTGHTNAETSSAGNVH